MRKLFALLICGGMLTLLTACGENGDSGSDSAALENSGIQLVESPTDDALGWGDFEIGE